MQFREGCDVLSADGTELGQVQRLAVRTGSTGVSSDGEDVGKVRAVATSTLEQLPR